MRSSSERTHGRASPGPETGDVQVRAQLMERLVGLSETLTGARSAEAIAAAIGRAALTLTGAPRAAVYYRSPAGVVTCPWSHGLSPGYIGRLVTPDSLNPWVHLTRHPELACMDLPRGPHGQRQGVKPALLSDVRTLPPFHESRRSAEHEGIRAFGAWSLLRGGTVIAAVVAYYDAPHEWSLPEREVMLAFSLQAAAALEHTLVSESRGRRLVQWEAERSSVAATRRELDIERARLDAARRELAAEHARLRDTRRELGAERARLMEARTEVAAEETRLDEARRSLEAEQGRLGETRTELDAEGVRLTALHRELEGEHAQLSAAQRDLEAERARLSETRRELDAEDARLTEAQKDLGAGHARLAEFQRELELEHARLTDARRDLEVEHARLDEARQDLGTERTGLAESQRTLEAEHARLAETRRALEAEHVRLSEMQNDLLAEHARLDATRTELGAESARLAEAQRTLEVEHARLSSARQGLDAEHARLAAAQRQVEAEQTRLGPAPSAADGPDAEHARVAEMRAELQVEQARLDAIRQRLEGEHTRISDSRRELEEEQARLAASQRELETEHTRLTDARRELDTEHARLSEARRDLGAEQARLAEARRDLETEHTRLAEVQRALEAESARLVEARQALEVESAQLSVARRALDADRARLTEAHRAQGPEGRRVPVDAAGSEPAGGPAGGGADGALRGTGGPPAGGRGAAATGEPVPLTGLLDELGVDPGAPETFYRQLVEHAVRSVVQADGGAALTPDEEVLALARSLDARRGRPAGTGERGAGWAEAVARALQCADDAVREIRLAALLRDLGAVCAPAEVPGNRTPTDEQHAALRRQPILAARILELVPGMGGVAGILRHRHEHWNGRGHPDGLAGDAIPLGARMLSVVDTYLDLITGCPGVPKLYYLDAVKALRRGAGTQFDPRVVEAFCAILQEERDAGR